MPLQEFTALLLLAAAITFSPGPNTTLATALAANRGVRAALPFAVAVPLGMGALFAACAAGFGALLVAVPALSLAIKLLGIAYLLWLAWKLSRAGVLGNTDQARLNVTFWQGMTLQFVNIKAWMLAISVVAGWLAGKPDFALRFSVVLPTLMVFGFCSNFTYIMVGAGLRGWLSKGRRLLWFNRAMALVLAATAAWMTTV